VECDPGSRCTDVSRAKLDTQIPSGGGVRDSSSSDFVILKIPHREPPARGVDWLTKSKHEESHRSPYA
jgi:hypothetical protein